MSRKQVSDAQLHPARERREDELGTHLILNVGPISSSLDDKHSRVRPFTQTSSDCESSRTSTGVVRGAKTTVGGRGAERRMPNAEGGVQRRTGRRKRCGTRKSKSDQVSSSPEDP